MSRLGVLLDQLETYEFTDVRGKTLAESKAYEELRAMAADMDRVLASAPQVGARALVSDRAASDPSVPKPPDAMQRRAKVIYTEVILPGVPQPTIVGWDTCGKCNLHVRICRCADGPTQPPSIQKWLSASGQDGSPKVGRYGQVIEDDPAEAKERQRTRVKEAAAAISATELPTGVCTGCGLEVSPENADQNDDGSWTCFVCQTGGSA